MIGDDWKNWGARGRTHVVENFTWLEVAKEYARLLTPKTRLPGHEPAE
jgi:hypothetical protein